MNTNFKTNIKRANKWCFWCLYKILILFFCVITVFFSLSSTALAQSSVPNENTWVTNGSVSAVVPSSDGTTIYIGGDFTYVGPNTVMESRLMQQQEQIKHHFQKLMELSVLLFLMALAAGILAENLLRLAGRRETELPIFLRMAV
jgi:hypothetical protein